MPRVARFAVVAAFLVAIVNACAAPAAAPTATSAPPAPPTATPAPVSSAQINVFAAASLTESFTELGKNFEAANPGTKVTFNFAGSNDLAAQIGKGAPADVFASANKAQMDVVVKSGQVAADAPKTFVRNRLVVVYPSANPGKITKLQDLGAPGVKVVLAAKQVPVGQYALDFLTKASADPSFGSDYQSAVTKNVVSYEQDVKAVLSKVALGEADAGIVYTTDVTPDAKAKVVQLDIPDPLNTIATYPIAAIKTSEHAAVAQRFVDYVLGPEGQKTLASYGFVPVNGAAAQ
jgi:molybdate transport system substrate-binding protein